MTPMSETSTAPSHSALFPWPIPSPPAAFAARRRKLRERFALPAAFAAGFPRPRNFPANSYPYRAESHFLYLTGCSVPGAVLVLSDNVECLFLPDPDPGDRLWHGPQPTLGDWAEQLQLQIRPLSAWPGGSGEAMPPHQCPRARQQLASLVGREPSSGPGRLSEADRELALALVDCRRVHDAAALNQLRQATRATAEVHRLAMGFTAVGQREVTVAAGMQAWLGARGMALAYAPIVSVRGEVLHGRASSRPLRAGDLLLVDVGAETPEGWAADVTRTWPVGGRFSPTQRALYEVVAAALAGAVAQVRPGQAFADVHAASHRALTQGLRDLGILRGSLEGLLERQVSAVFYPHGVGHLLGLDVHDMEDLGDLAGYPAGARRQATAYGRYLRLGRTLEPDMVVTIEPGFYQIPELLDRAREDAQLRDAIDWSKLSQFSDVRGVRLEDDVRVSPAGPQRLSEGAPLLPDEVEAACQSAEPLL